MRFEQSCDCEHDASEFTLRVSECPRGCENAPLFHWTDRFISKNAFLTPEAQKIEGEPVNEENGGNLPLNVSCFVCLTMALIFE